MGVNMSSERQKNKATKSETGPKMKAVIKAFHTKDQWNTYFNASMETNKLVVIDFTATWCGPCKTMEPVFKEFCEKYTDVEFVKIDVDELPDVAAEFGVQAMPTFVLIKRGNQVDKLVGANKQDLGKKIEKHRKSN